MSTAKFATVNQSSADDSAYYRKSRKLEILEQIKKEENRKLGKEESNWSNIDELNLKFKDKKEVSSILGTEPPKYVRGKEGLGGGGSMYAHKNQSASRLENGTSNIYRDSQMSLNNSVDNIYQI